MAYGNELEKLGGKATTTVTEEFDPLGMVDYVVERLALPKPGPLFKFLSPKSILKTLGVKTLDEIGEELLERVRDQIKTRRPY